ncbi:MAG: hypothetical protein WCG25_05115 [bacterium]
MSVDTHLSSTRALAMIAHVLSAQYLQWTNVCHDLRADNIFCRSDFFGG